MIVCGETERSLGLLEVIVISTSHGFEPLGQTIGPSRDACPWIVWPTVSNCPCTEMAILPVDKLTFANELDAHKAPEASEKMMGKTVILIFITGCHFLRIKVGNKAHMYIWFSRPLVELRKTSHLLMKSGFCSLHNPRGSQEIKTNRSEFHHHVSVDKPQRYRCRHRWLMDQPR